MQLVESYLNEVGRFLPRPQRDDVLGELRTTIEEELAERAASKGRPPTREDEAAVLERYGHPLRVASGYHARRYLIGPDLFPAFKQTLSTLLALVLAAQLFLALALAAARGASFSLSGLFAQTLESVVWVSVIVTLVFVSIEGAGARLRWYDSWEPKALGSGSVSVVDRADVITNMITEGLFLLWWNGALALRNWLADWSDHGSRLTFSLAEAWRPLQWPLNVVFGALFLLHAFVLVRGLWHRSSLVAEIALGLGAMAAVTWLLLQGGPLVVVGGSPEAFSLAAFERTARWSLLALAGFFAWDVLKAARLLLRR